MVPRTDLPFDRWMCARENMNSVRRRSKKICFTTEALPQSNARRNIAATGGGFRCGGKCSLRGHELCKQSLVDVTGDRITLVVTPARRPFTAANEISFSNPALKITTSESTRTFRRTYIYSGLHDRMAVARRANGIPGLALP
jgi:hypothetical protein